MKCDEAINRLMDLDNGEQIPDDVARHLQECVTCRREAEVLFQALTALEAQNLVVMTPDVAVSVMERIRWTEDQAVAQAESDRHMPMRNWIVVGAIILFSMFLVPFSNSLTWLTDAFGSSLEIPLYIILGIVVAAYATLFIGTHVDQVAEKLGVKE
jgi:hypothetical protein